MMDIQRIETLLTETQAGLDRFKASGESETSRVYTQEKAIQLARALERPRNAILKFSYSVALRMAMACMWSTYG